jgi:cell division protease FtsH
MARERRRFTRRSRRPRPSRIGLWCGLAIAVLLAAYAGVIELSRPHVDGQRLRYDEFVRLAQDGRIENAEILNQDAVVVGRFRRRDGSIAEYNAPYLRTAGSQDMLVQTLVRRRVPTTIDQQFAKSLVLPATLLLPALILVVIFVYLIVSYRRGTGLFGIRSGARRLRSSDAPVTFADVAGQDAAIAELRDLVLFLSEPERFAGLGARIPKGILLYGPPGCGKTLLARALAGEAGAAFYSISGSDFVELYVGVGAARVRDLFAEARENAPAIVFVDELDSVGRRRASGSAVASGEEQEQALNQFLAEMDGFSPSEGIIVLGATNRPDLLDPALLRPGRFDRTVGLERPDEEGRLAILALHAGARRLDRDVDLRAIARRAIGLTGADLASVVNEGALLAGRAGRQAIGQAELDEGLRRILEAPERQRRLSLRDPSVGRRATTASERVTFADVAGVDEALEELIEVRDYLAEPERFASMGARVPRGIMLSGPPGCGKTLLARAVAGEANAAFFSVSATEFVEVYVGQGAARVRDLFAEARSVAPAILFIDEIDAVGGRRVDAGVEGSREREQTLNQILVELDGFDPAAGVVVMAATNRPDMLDPALVRPGRFDRHVAVQLPDRAGRAAILRVHAEGKRLGADVDLERVARLTPGFSGADLAAVLNEAALLAARRRLPEVPMDAVEEAMERLVLGVSSRRHVLTAEERRTVAYHEAGHALVALSLPGARVPHKLSVIPRGRALGFVWEMTEDDRAVHPRSDLVDQLAMLLGGRVAELMVFGEPSSGAADDLRRATAMARRMVCELGMSDAVGGVSYADPDGDERGPWSEEELRLVGAEVRRLVEEAERLARRVLDGARGTLEDVAAALLEREVLSAHELEAIVDRGAPRPPAGAGSSGG